MSLRGISTINTTKAPNKWKAMSSRKAKRNHYLSTMGGGKTKVHIPAKTHFIISKKRLHVAENLDW